MSVTEGTLLNGRVRYAQPAIGYRTGIEPVLLAAAVPAERGDRVLEVGTGAGAGLLCLAARVAGISGLGIERDHDQAALANANIAANDFPEIAVEAADITAWRGTTGAFAHAFANPPWHRERSTASPTPAKQDAKQETDGLIAHWVAAMAAALRPRGTLSLILPAASLAAGVTALADSRCAEIRLLPLWPRQARAAKIIILQGVRDGRGACSVGAGLTLHGEDGGFTDAARAILWGGQALTI